MLPDRLGPGRDDPEPCRRLVVPIIQRPRQLQKTATCWRSARVEIARRRVERRERHDPRERPVEGLIRQAEVDRLDRRHDDAASTDGFQSRPEGIGHAVRVAHEKPGSGENRLANGSLLGPPLDLEPTGRRGPLGFGAAGRPVRVSGFANRQIVADRAVPVVADLGGSLVLIRNAFDPERVPLKRIAGKPTGPSCRCHAVPGDGEAQRVERAESAEQVVATHAPAAESRQDGRGSDLVRSHVRQCGFEDRVRTDFEEGVGLIFRQRGRRGAETDCVAEVARPVFGTEFATVDRPAGHAGNDRNPCCSRDDAREPRKQFRSEWVHLKGMKRTAAA